MTIKEQNEFDHTATYYRVVETKGHPGYYYDNIEMEQMERGHGLLTDIDVTYQFSDISGIGNWLHLGKAVRRLRVPSDAIVERNVPFSQGGCYTWIANSVELLDIISIAELMQIMVELNKDIGSVILRNYVFPENFVFPRSISSLFLDDCVLHSRIIYPERIVDFGLSKCSFENMDEAKNALPKVVEERWSLSYQELSHVQCFLKKPGSINLSYCVLRSIIFPKEVDYFTAFNCKFEGDCIFPQQISHPPSLNNCTFEHPHQM